MNSKIRNSIIQKFSMVGYQCLENTRQTLWLVNSKRNLEIRYDMRKYPCIYGKISHIRELRCNIIIRYGYHSVECFSMRDFKALHIEDDVLVYNDQEHFEQAILEFTERLLTDGIPILDELVSSLVYVEENFYERLSQEPEKQAKEFAICLPAPVKAQVSTLSQILPHLLSLSLDISYPSFNSAAKSTINNLHKL